MTSNMILISIRKPYSRQIILGEKKFELRKRLPRLGFRYALIYETHPTKAIIGFFEVNKIHIESIDKIWEISKGGSCVSKDFFKKYYQDKDIGIAIEIKESHQFKRKIPLTEIGINRAPQDFQYVNGEGIRELVAV